MKTCYNCFSEISADGVKFCPHCGSSAELRNGDKYPHALPCGSVLKGKYIVGRVLGQGGFGITYIGQQYDTKQLVAIKEYFPDTMATRTASHSVAPFNSDRSEGFEYGKKQFLDEAKTLSAFIGSPNIVRVYSYFEENGTAYFVMEYVRGKSLKQYVVSRGGHISWEEAWDLLMPVLYALSEVHYRNIIHRDIKPDNIIITESGSATLIDFGAARYSHSEKSKSLTAVLTPGYAPLEQYFSRGRQGPWTDVYALAATIYFCITGKAPVESVERSVDDALKKPSELGAAIPPYAEAALMKALSVRIKDRYESTYDFRNAVLEGKRLEKNTGKDSRRPQNERSTEKKSGREEYQEQPQSQPQSQPWERLRSNPQSQSQPQLQEEMFRKTHELALQGDPEAQYLLGYFYESGKGVQQSDEQAEKWYRKAADQGNTAAREKLGLLTEKKPDKGQDGDKRGNLQPRKNRAGGIILAVGLIALIAVAGSLILKVISGQSSGTVKDSTKQITEGTDNTGGQDGGSAQEENEEEEPVQITRSTDAPMELTDSWEEIAAAGHDGTYKDRYRIGDTKELDMGSEGIITMKLVAMDEDELADGSGKAPMTWVADELLRSKHNMNSELTNEGGWEASEMRAWLRETVLPLMPEEVRDNIREVTKYSYSHEEQKGVASKDTIWIPSLREVFPAGYDDWTDECREQEGVSYTGEIKDDESRMRSRDGESGASWWWLRSASYNGSCIFDIVGSDGDYYYYFIAYYEGGVVIGFCF